MLDSTRPLRCFIAEDQPMAQVQIREYIEEFTDLDLIDVDGNVDRIEAKLRANPVDLLFLDLHLIGGHGFDLLQRLPQPWPLVIVMTAFGQQNALRGFDQGVVDYLSKPLKEARFVLAVERAKERHWQQSAMQTLSFPPPGPTVPVSVHIRVKGGVERIELSAIKSVESSGNYVKIHKVEGTPTISRMTLEKILEHLPHTHFQRISKSVIVNRAKIHLYLTNMVQLTTGESYATSPNYKL